MTGIQATGKIKTYQIIVGALIFLNLPITYFFLQQNASPEIVFKVSIFINVLSLFVRLLFLQKLINLNIGRFFYTVLLPIAGVTTGVALFMIFINKYILFDNELSNVVFLSFSSIVSCFVLVWTISLNKQEKKYLIDLIKRKIRP